jgi:hypothetical protein
MQASLIKMQERVLSPTGCMRSSSPVIGSDILRISLASRRALALSFPDPVSDFAIPIFKKWGAKIAEGAWRLFATFPTPAGLRVAIMIPLRSVPRS